MKQPFLSFEDYPLLEFQAFGEAPYDIVINCPHGYHGSKFLQHFPFLQECFSSLDTGLFSHYLSLEWDFGSLDLAIAIATALQNKKSVAVISINVPRGIMDPNRLEGNCVRRMFDHRKHFQVVELLQKMNRDISDAILDFCKDNLSPSGMFLDCHSMWPSSQKEHPEGFENPDQLEHYIFSLINPKNQKGSRPINFLLSEDENAPLADLKKTNILLQQLANDGFVSQINTPYCLKPHYRSTYYYQFVSGVSFDVPRNLLGNIISYQNLFPLWEVDEKKITTLAASLAQGLLQA